jgi:pyruvate/2-oxoglutarate dehydrogenase complex dihydrolipoamide acyltransferase (E2) component
VLVQTEQVNTEVDAPVAGVLTERTAASGATVLTGEPVGYVEQVA